MRPRIWPRQPRYFLRLWAFPLLLAGALAAWTIGWLDGSSSAIAGRAFVVDGDTLRIGAQRIRLVGLDAPELDQSCLDAGGAKWPCGAAAKSFLVDMLQGKDLSCSGSGRDFYGRVLAACSIDGADVGQRIVGAGWATSDLGYPREEGEARLARLGIWSGTLTSPAEWRRSREGGAAAIWEWIRSWFQ